MTGTALLVVFALVAAGASRGEERAGDARMAADCATGSASVQPLAKIVNTRDASFDCVGLSLDDHANIRALRFEKHELSPRADAPTAVAAPVHVREFTPAEISSSRGAVLDGVPGHDALTLRGDLNDDKTTVPLLVSFLYNGLTGEYHSCTTTLLRGSDRRWRLLDARQRQVSLVRVQTWGLPLVGTVGIAAIQGLCSREG
jgi:hypothetical protein